MSYVSDFGIISSATATTSVSVTTALLPEHVADDVIVLAVTTGINSTISESGGGWTQILTTQVSGALVSAAMFYKKAAGASESATIALGTSNAYHITAFIIKDVDTTTALAGTAVATVKTTASQISNTTMTTTSDDALLLFWNALDSTATTPPACHTAPDGNSHFLDSSDNGGSASASVIAGAASAWYFQRTAGATPTPAWNLSLTNVTICFTVAFKNKTSGLIPAYIDNTAAAGTKLMDGHWWASATTRNNENFKATPLTVTSIITHLGTLTGAFDAGASVVDTHINPYSASVNSSPTTSAANLTGFELGFPTTAINMTSGWIVGSLMMSGPKLANYSHGDIKKGGTFLSIGSTTNYRIFQIMAKDNLVNTEGRAVFSVQANQTQTQSGASGTAPTITAIDKLCILNRGNVATLALYCADFHLIQKITAAGGDAVNPVGSEELYNIGKFLRLKLIQRLGASGLMPMVPVQIGGGDAINFQIDAGALQFPRIYSRAFREINYHGADNAIGISYAGKSGDVIKHTNSVVTSESPYYWEINSAATSAATWDFTGLVVVKANVTLRNVTTFSSMAFSNCPTLVFSGCTVTDCKISGVPATSDSITTSTTAVLNLCAINVSTVTAGNHWWSGADPTSIFTNCVFTGGGGHALSISAAGGSTITLTGNTWTSFGADGSTGAALLFTAGSGTVTVNIVGGDIPTYKATGMTINFVNAKTVRVTVKDVATDAAIENARVLVEAATGGDLSVGTDILTGLTNASGIIQTTTFNYTSDQPVTGVARRGSTAYGTLYKQGSISGTISSSGLDLTVLLSSDE